MIKGHLIIIFLAVMFTCAVQSKPNIESESESTLVFTMWDLKSDKTFVVDLEQSISSILRGKSSSFHVDLKTLINSQFPEVIEDFTLVRWGVMGSLQPHDGFGGYVASYDAPSAPDDKSAYPWIAQRINRIGRYLNSGLYSKGNKNGKYEISIRELGDTAGHYATGWQGNINGLTKKDMEARLKKSTSEMQLWSVHIEEIKVDKKTMTVVPEYITQKHGNLFLTTSGILKFTKE